MSLRSELAKVEVRPELLREIEKKRPDPVLSGKGSGRNFAAFERDYYFAAQLVMAPFWLPVRYPASFAAFVTLFRQLTNWP